MGRQDEVENEVEYGVYLGEEGFICVHTGKDREECMCLSCFPAIFRFKWICADCKTIDDVIATLNGIAEYFENLKSEGWAIGGPIEDDYMELIPPKRKGYTWFRCKSCGQPFMVQKGVVPPKTCTSCDVKEDLD